MEKYDVPVASEKEKKIDFWRNLVWAHDLAKIIKEI